MTKYETATDVLTEAIETGRDVADVYREAVAEMEAERPAWATVRDARTNDDGSGLWYERTVGRGYYLYGIGHDADTLLDDEQVTFTLSGSTEQPDGIPESYIRQNDGQGMAFASAAAMRRYAEVLLEVANDVDRVMDGTR